MDWKSWFIIGVLIADIITSILVFFFQNDLFWMIIFHWWLMFLGLIVILIMAFALRNENENLVVR